MTQQKIIISGMTCGACVKLITKILSRMSGVKSVLMVDQGSAIVVVDTIMTKDVFINAFINTPYKVESVS